MNQATRSATASGRRGAVHPVDPAHAAAMFRTNLSVWRHEPQAREVAGEPTLDRIDRALAALPTGPITWGLCQIAYEREPSLSQRNA